MVPQQARMVAQVAHAHPCCTPRPTAGVSVETLGLESDGVLLELMGRALLLGDPDAAQELYTAAPEDWPLQV